MARPVTRCAASQETLAVYSCQSLGETNRSHNTPLTPQHSSSSHTHTPSSYIVHVYTLHPLTPSSSHQPLPSTLSLPHAHSSPLNPIPASLTLTLPPSPPSLPFFYPHPPLTPHPSYLLADDEGYYETHPKTSAASTDQSQPVAR